MNKVEFSRTAKIPFEKRYGNFIGGKWAEPRSGKYYVSLIEDRSTAFFSATSLLSFLRNGTLR